MPHDNKVLSLMLMAGQQKLLTVLLSACLTNALTLKSALVPKTDDVSVRDDPYTEMC
jgi:hypothetical protein